MLTDILYFQRSILTTTNKSKPKKWEIWLAQVRFEDRNEVKIRPVLVISEEIAFILSLKITSHSPRNCKGEYSIHYWEWAGLNKPSTVRVSKALQLQPRDFVKKIGDLHMVDIIRVKSIWATLNR